MRSAGLVALLALLALLALAAAPAAAADGDATTRPDPPSDRLGWEAGYWHDDPVAVDPSDGLNDTELDRVVARSMARVEYVRGLEFERQVDVTVVSRETYADQVADGYRNVSTGNRLHQDVKYEALFMLGEDESAVDGQRDTTTASTGGFYAPGPDRIVVVSENATAPRMNEITLAQELFHALQYRRFDVGSYEMDTRETHNARDGIVEGDGNYVDYLYEQRCGDVWNGTCLRPAAGGSGGGGGGASPHYGMLYLRFQPYSDGPPFVREIRERGGWAAVNAVYDDPPASTEQTIHPEKYGVDEPRPLTVPDRSSAAWYRPDTGGVRYASFGEAGLFTMFLYPSIESGGRTQLLSLTDFYNFTAAGTLSPVDPFNYTSRYSAGWDGDRLVPYARNDSAATNETGYVWKLAWDTEADAREFVAGYRQLLDYHGAERAGERTWRIPDGDFADAFHVTVTGETVVVTNAPTVAELDDVRSSVTVNRSATPTATTGTPGTTDDVATTPPPTTESPGTPGFGVAAALVALAAAALVGWRR
jgi:PGF-CTERM protein